MPPEIQKQIEVTNKKVTEIADPLPFIKAEETPAPKAEETPAETKPPTQITIEINTEEKTEEKSIEQMVSESTVVEEIETELQELQSWQQDLTQQATQTTTKILTLEQGQILLTQTMGEILTRLETIAQQLTPPITSELGAVDTPMIAHVENAQTNAPQGEPEPVPQVANEQEKAAAKSQAQKAKHWI